MSKGGRRRWREGVREGVRQVGEHTVTVHVGDKNDLLLPFLTLSLPPSSPFPPSLLSLSSLPSLTSFTSHQLVST